MPSHRWSQRGADIDGEASFQSGWSVALSADGGVLAVGAPGFDNTRGRVHVFAWDGTAHAPVGGNLDGTNEEDWFGSSVALSDDGQVLVAGAWQYDGTSSNTEAGYARVYAVQFHPSPPALPLPAPPPPPSQPCAPNADAGSAAAVSVEGGVYYLDGATTPLAVAAGVTYYFTGIPTSHPMKVWRPDGDAECAVQEHACPSRHGGTDYCTGDASWTIPTGCDHGAFSLACAIHGAMGATDRLVLGASCAPPSPPPAPPPPPMHQTVAGYAPVQTIYGAQSADEAGNRVALSADGKTLAVAAHKNDGNDHPTDSKRGHVRVYRHNGAGWDQLGGEHDILGDASANLGYSVSLSADGNILAAGAPVQQYLRVVRWTGNAWESMGQNGGMISETTNGFDAEVAISDDGHTLLASARYAGYMYAYAYDVDQNAWSAMPGDAAAMQVGSGWFGWRIALSGDGRTAALSTKLQPSMVRVYRWDDVAGWQTLHSNLCTEVTGVCTSGEAYWLSLSHDGNTVAIGDFAADDPGKWP